MMPTVGAAFDMLNAAWYYAEGNYGEAALSFFVALPGIGDMAVAGVKGLGFCTKGAKIFRLAAKIIGNAGNIALAAPKATEAIIQLWDKHVFKGQAWDDKSLSLAIEGATFGITAILSAKNLGETFGNIRNELNDIKTSQCFVEGTLIVTADGDKPIEEIQAGDLVYSTDPETGESEYKEVLRTFRKESDVIIHIFVNGEEIQTTPVHPFWVEDQWVAAKDLEEGDILTLADGTTAPVTYTYGEQLDEPVIVYNFEVSDFHTYYVTDTGVLVHNTKCGPEHRNSKNNDSENHVYVIVDEDGNLVKVGVSGRPLNKNGSSNRANTQVNRFNKNGEKTRPVVIEKGLSRKEALDLERQITAKHNARNNGNMPSEHHRRPITGVKSSEDYELMYGIVHNQSLGGRY